MNKIPVRHIKEPDFSDSFSIRDIIGLLSGKDLIQDLHRHNFFFVLVLEKGSGEHIIDFVSYPINDYSVFFMQPGQVHQLKLNSGSTGYMMQFNADFYLPREQSSVQVFRKVSNKDYCQITAEQTHKLMAVLDYIVKEYTDKQERYKEIIIANLEIFFIELVRQSKNSKNLSKTENSYSQERLEELQQLFHNHITTVKKVAQYAEMLHLTPYQLNGVTKEILGKTCSQLINEHILLEVKRRLLATSNQVNQIAYDMGYEDVSYFIRFFKKHMGVSPETFRQNFK